MKKIELKVGEIFNYWKVVELLPACKALFLCIGCNKTEKIILRSQVRLGYTKSCGCKLKEIQRQTNLKRYGTENTSELKEVKDKIKQTNLERYQVDNPRKAKIVKDKIIKTKKEKYGENLERLTEKKKENYTKKYGVDSQFKRQEVQNKIRQTKIKRYGVEHQLQNSQVRDKVKQTSLERYGKENPLSNPDIRLKGKKTLLEKYNVDHPSKMTENYIKTSDGTLLIDLAEKNKVPRCTVYKIFKEYGEDTLLKFCEEYNKSISSLELRSLELLREIDPSLEHYNKQPKENIDLRCKPDFRIELNERVLYINVDGLYRHSELQKEDTYHLNLREKFEESNLRLMQFREDEIRDKKDIVLSIVKSFFGIFKEKINARDCKVKKIKSDDADLFFSQNHLMSKYKAAESIGLYYKDNLVQCISIRKGDKIEIARFCSKINISVRGGFGKLLSYIKKQYNPKEIVSFCDLRYADGHSYLINGFIKVKTTLGWNWTDLSSTYNRLRCRANMDSRKLTQTEHAKELKWIKIYDAGQVKFMWKGLK